MLKVFFILILNSLAVIVSAKDLLIDINEFNHAKPTNELSQIESYYPKIKNWDSDLLELLKYESNCNFFSRDLISKLKQPMNKEVNKYSHWLEFNCGLIHSLPDDFFTQAPYLHPLGGSWVLYAFKIGKGPYAKTEWLQKNIPFTHSIELSEISNYLTLDGVERVLADLDEDQWKQIVGADPIIVTKNYILQKENNIYRVKNKLFTEFFQSKLFVVLSSLLILTLLLTVVILVYRLIQFRRKAWQDKELMMQTIAHELRHPVTSMQLSLEVLRNDYDLLSS